MGEKKKEAQTSEMARCDAISNWLTAFGAPEIMVADKDSGFIGEFFQEFRDARNIIPQTVIPGHHQSLGATERRRGLFCTIIDHVIGNRKPNSLGRKERGGISGNDDDALKFTGSEIWRFRAMKKGFRKDTRNADWGGW